MEKNYTIQVLKCLSGGTSRLSEYISLREGSWIGFVECNEDNREILGPLGVVWEMTNFFWSIFRQIFTYHSVESSEYGYVQKS